MHASELIARLSAGRGEAALVIVVAVQGSSPRHPGSKMLVYPDGTTAGTVGGGIVEAKAKEEALACIRDGRSGRLVADMLGERATGSDPICGGAVTMAVLLVADTSAYAAASASLDRGERVVLVHALEGLTGGSSCIAVVGSDGRRVYGNEATIDDEAARSAFGSSLPVVSAKDGYLYDLVEPLDRLLILGGGHVGLALARFASELDFSVCVGDFRQEFVDPARFPAGTETKLGDFTRIIADYPFGASTYVVVSSPSHSSDLECVRAILAREYKYAGFMGSRRKTKMILEQAVADGFPAERVYALRAPIGADIGAETPAEIAVSILAEMIAVRRNSPTIAAMDSGREKRRS